MNDKSCYMIGVLSGIVCFMLVLTYFPSLHAQAKEAVTNCEKSLPRDQTCKVIAVPVEKEQ